MINKAQVLWFRQIKFIVFQCTIKFFRPNFTGLRQQIWRSLRKRLYELIGTDLCLTLFFNLRNTVPLFVFSICDPKQNARSLLTPVSDAVFYALSHGSLSFALHGSFFNHLLIGWKSSIANQYIWNRRLLELPWRTRCKLPCKSCKRG